MDRDMVLWFRPSGVRFLPESETLVTLQYKDFKCDYRAQGRRVGEACSDRFWVLPPPSNSLLLGVLERL